MNHLVGLDVVDPRLTVVLGSASIAVLNSEKFKVETNGNTATATPVFIGIALIGLGLVL